MKVYMKVTKDEYELPLAIADSLKELSLLTGTKISVIKSSISHGYLGWCKVIINE